MLVKITKTRQNKLRKEKDNWKAKKKMLARKFQSLKYKWFVLSVRAELYMLIGIQVPEQLY